MTSAQGVPGIHDRYGYPYTLRFFSVSGFLSGDGSRGCERLYGKFEGNLKRFAFKALQHPRPCIGDANEGHREISVGRALSAASRINIKSTDQIEFVAKDGSLIALSRFKPRKEQRPVLSPGLRSLVSGTWVVESINGQPVSRLLPFKFAYNGKVDWSDGCNSSSGEYGGTPDNLVISNVITSVVACRPEGASFVIGPEVKRLSPRRLEFRDLAGRAMIVRRADQLKR